MQNNVKSSVTAGLLGVFLGLFGAHQWYLGETKKAITHVCLCVGGFIMLIIGVILYNWTKDLPVFSMLFVCLMVMSYVILIGNEVWGVVEGVILLVQGDAGLAAKGYAVANDMALNRHGLVAMQPSPTNANMQGEVDKQPAKPPVVMAPLAAENGGAGDASNGMPNAETDGGVKADVAGSGVETEVAVVEDAVATASSGNEVEAITMKDDGVSMNSGSQDGAVETVASETVLDNGVANNDSGEKAALGESTEAVKVDENVVNGGATEGGVEGSQG